MNVAGIFGVLFTFLMAALYIGVFVFMLIMMYKMVKAIEKIASSLERGLFIQKQEVESEKTD